MSENKKKPVYFPGYKSVQSVQFENKSVQSVHFGHTDNSNNIKTTSSTDHSIMFA